MSDVLKLSSGYDMPVIGLGVWRINKAILKDLVVEAINIGYRHFDCAAEYNNEDEVGKALEYAIKDGLVDRKDLFITSKLWNSDHGHVREACLASLRKLRLTYLDLYLVHYPLSTQHTGIGSPDSKIGDDGVLDIDCSVPLHETWKEMENLVRDGLVRSIGISNYDIFLTADCLSYATIKPAVNQFETHIYFQRPSLLKFCSKKGVTVTAHTPLGGATANKEMFQSDSPLDEPKLKALSHKYRKSPCQLLLRWGVQRKTAVIPKTCNIERLKENFDIHNFEISEEDMMAMAQLDKNARSNNPKDLWGIDLYG